MQSTSRTAAAELRHGAMKPVSRSHANPELSDRGRVLVVAHAWYGDTIGGAFRLASEFAEDLADRGERVDYLCCAPADATVRPGEERQGGVTIHRYPPPPAGIGPVSRMRHHVGHSRRLARRLGESRPIRAVSGHSPLQFLGAAQALGGSAYLNYTVHSPFDDELAANTGNLSGLRRLARVPSVRAARWIDRRNCRVADRVQCNSHYTLETLRRKHGRCVIEKGCVAPGWVDYRRYSAAGSRDAARRTLGEGWQTGAPLFFTLRRLEARMGLDTLIEAAALVRDRGHEFRVLVGGSGALRRDLEQSVRNFNLDAHVRFLGRVPEADLPACYAAADCFVLPTRALECFGLIVLEAYAAGTPVIASRAAAIPEIAARQGAGWDFEPGNARELADRMEACLAGRLRPSCDLRAIAREFDRRRVFEDWRSLLLGTDNAGDAPALRMPELVDPRRE
jgi:glycosyltransferase involved in cell wall biosynthesis